MLGVDFLVVGGWVGAGVLVAGGVFVTLEVADLVLGSEITLFFLLLK